MRLRYTLNNEIEGEEITTYSPKGWEETELILKRHEKYDGIFKDYTGKVEFFCGSGKEYIDNIYETQGIEAEVSVMIEIDCDDSDTYITLYNGKAIMKSYDKVAAAPEYTRVNLEQNGIIQTVLNRMDTKVNLSAEETLDGNALDVLTYGWYTLNMHGKTVQFISLLDISNPDETPSFSETETGAGVIGGTGTVTIDLPFNGIPYDELEGLNFPAAPFVQSTTPIVFPSGAPTELFTNNNDDPVEVLIEYDIEGVITELGTLDREYDLLLYYKIGASFGVASPITIHSYGHKTLLADELMTEIISQVGNLILTIPPAESLYVYFQLTDYTTGNGVRTSTITGDFTALEMRFTQDSVFRDTTAKASAVFETGAQIARVITDQVDAFRSNYFGRLNSEPYQYTENGCGSFSAITNGFQIRGFPSSGLENGRTITMSMREYFEGLTAIHCLGLGVKEEGDNTYIEVEPKEYFYRNETILTFSNVKNLKTRVDEKLFFSRVKIGYEKWRKEGSNGLDEFCTTYNYTTLLKSISNELDVVSKLIAAPYAIERQRRKQYNSFPTDDGEYDDDNFIIALNRTVDYGDAPSRLDDAEKDENFTNVSKVFSPETIYNLRFKPARNLKNWLKILGTSVIKSNAILKNIKFSSAEGNYRIISQGTETCDPGNQTLITSNEDIELSIPNSSDNYEPLFTGETDEFDIPMSLSDYITLKEVDISQVPNFYKKIQYSTTEEDYITGYISEIRFKPVRGVASCKTMRAYNASGDCSHIYVEEDYVECGYVE